jgi:Ala-tRNA(Pro) deacylase
MSIATTLTDFLGKSEAVYSVMRHRHSSSSMDTAEAAHVSGKQIAKAVVLKDERGYVMAVIPASNKARLGVISQMMDRRLYLAKETDFENLFKDCEIGAVPAIGQVYGMETIWDDELTAAPEIFCESGDHETLIEMKCEQFKDLMSESRHGQISSHI